MKVFCKLILTIYKNFTHVVKYFSVTTAFVFYCDAKHLDI